MPADNACLQLSVTVSLCIVNTEFIAGCRLPAHHCYKSVIKTTIYKAGKFTQNEV
jgi:hypothetical protein